MPLIPRPTREAFDRIIYDEFNARLKRRPAISEELKKYFEKARERLVRKVREQVQAKLEVGMKPNIRQEAADIFESWLNELLLNRFIALGSSD